MAYEFRLPDIGEGVVEGEVVRWLVKEGDSLVEDQPMVEIMTDKATVEIGRRKVGRVAKRMFAEGELCPVGKVLITIEVDGEGGKAPSAEPDAPAAALAATPGGERAGGGDGKRRGRRARSWRRRRRASSRATSASTSARSPAPGAPAASPPTTSRRMARAGRRPAAAPRAAVSHTDDVRVPFRGLRKKIAENLVRSKQTAAHFTYVEEVDCTELVALRAKLNAGKAGVVKLSFLPFIIKATIGALQKFPQLNATLDEDAGEIVQRRNFHIGLATATEDGLIVPVVRDADRKSLVDLGARSSGWPTRRAPARRRARSSWARPSPSPAWARSAACWRRRSSTSPRSRSSGVHKIAKRPAVVGDQIVIRDLMNLSISFDHRVVDGFDAAQFVAEIKRTLETPAPLGAEAV